MKKRTIIALLLAAVMALTLAGCGNGSQPAATTGGQPAAKKLVVGFSQIGAESPWRIATTDSIKGAIEKAGFELKYSDGQSKQENQIKAIRSFIQQKVDVIVFTPVVETGWDAVLQEARDAKIPVIIDNRQIKVSSGNREDYYTTFIGPDNIMGGQKAANFLLDTFKDAKSTINIVEIEGTVGSSMAIERKKGFDDVMSQHSNFKIIKSQTGENTRAKAKEVMEAILKTLKAEGQKMDALYVHNDEMALGCEQAIEEAGLKPGQDVKIVSIDGQKAVFEAMAAGKHTATLENPVDYGTPIVEVIKQIQAGKTSEINKRIIMEYKLWTADQAAAELPNRKY
jgi:ABC-type sugar transport system substrate-binding protein